MPKRPRRRSAHPTEQTPPTAADQPEVEQEQEGDEAPAEESGPVPPESVTVELPEVPVRFELVEPGSEAEMLLERAGLPGATITTGEFDAARPVLVERGPIEPPERTVATISRGAAEPEPAPADVECAAVRVGKKHVTSASDWTAKGLDLDDEGRPIATLVPVEHVEPIAVIPADVAAPTSPSDRLRARAAALEAEVEQLERCEVAAVQRYTELQAVADAAIAEAQTARGQSRAFRGRIVQGARAAADLRAKAKRMEG